MNKLSISKRVCVLFVFCAATAIATSAQTFKTLHSFDGTDGETPFAGLIQGTDGNFYGTTEDGGAYGDGTIFKITAGGTLTTLHTFDGTDGDNPYGGLVQGTDGKFYGTTLSGGDNNSCPPYVGCGTVFSITAGGKLKTLYIFCSQSNCADAPLPSTLVQAADGNFYGTTFYGGANDQGTVFSITTSGTLTTLHSFVGIDGDGENPHAGLVQGTDGKFYGTTQGGGVHGYGAVFSITAGGTLTTLHSFNTYPAGTYPQAALVQGTDGDLYGTTEYGGRYDDGTVFSITARGTLTMLYSFCPHLRCTDGTNIFAGLIQGTDGNFYGTTFDGGAYNDGTLFKITPTGTLRTLHSFDGTDGENPYAALVQGTNGNFYGTTYAGGANGDGTVFSLSVGLGPFVETDRTSGKVGAAVKILGTDLTGATIVTFSGTSATFTVKSESEIITTVPTGATTGTVQVVTPTGTLSSNVPFRVLP